MLPAAAAPERSGCSGRTSARLAGTVTHKRATGDLIEAGH
jgi:hypothetical protein